MKTKYVFGSVCIVCMSAVEAWALYLGIDSQGLGAFIGAVGLIAGIIIGRKTS